MVDELKFSFGDDEYKLEEDNNVALRDSNVSNNSSNISSSLIEKASKFKRILVPIILISVIVSVYQLLNWYSNKRADEALQQENLMAQKQPIAQEPVIAIQKSLENVSPIVQPKSLNSSDTKSNNEDDISTKQKLDVLAERTEKNTIEIMRISDALTQNQGSFVGLNQSVKELSKAVQSLNSDMQKIIANTNKPKIVKKIKKNVPPSVMYRVKAIVPGMAWLESSNNKTIAVRVGQELSGYGTIRLISPNDGMVITSSGYVIQYGVNDF